MQSHNSHNESLTPSNESTHRHLEFSPIDYEPHDQHNTPRTLHQRFQYRPTEFRSNASIDGQHAPMQRTGTVV